MLIKIFKTSNVHIENKLNFSNFDENFNSLSGLNIRNLKQGGVLEYIYSHFNEYLKFSDSLQKMDYLKKNEEFLTIIICSKCFNIHEFIKEDKVIIVKAQNILYITIQTCISLYFIYF